MLLKKIYFKSFTNKKIYFYKIFMFFLVFFLLISALSIFSYSYIRNSIVKDIDNINFNIINSISGEIKKEILEIQQVAFFIGKEIQRNGLYISGDFFENNKTISLYNLRRSLIDIYSIKSIVDSSAIYFKRSDILISSEGVYENSDIFDYLSNYKLHNEYLLEHINNDGKLIKIFPSTIVKVQRPSDNTGYFNKIIIPFFFFYKEYINLDVIFIINLKESYFSQLLHNFVRDKYELFIISKDGDFISSSHTDVFSIDDKYVDILEKIQNNEDKNLPVKIKGSYKNKNYIFYTKQIDYPEWYLSVAMPEGALESQYRNLIFLVFIILLIIIFSGLLMVYFFSRNLYAPINSIINLLTQIDKEDAIRTIHARSNEIEYIKENLNILKENKEYLNKKITKMTPYFTEKLIDKFFNTEDISNVDDEIKEIFEEIDDNSEKGYVLVFFRMFYSNSFVVDFHDKDIFKVKMGIISFLKEITECSFENIIFVQKTEELCYCVIRIDTAQQKQKFIDVIENVLDVLKNDSNYLRLYVFIGCIQKKLKGIFSSYKELLNIIDFISLGSESSIIDIQKTDINQIKEDFVYYPMNIDEKIYNCILNKDMVQVNKIIDDIFNINFKDNYYTLIKLKKLYHFFENALIKICYNYNIDFCEIEERMKNKIFNSISLQESKNFLIEIISNISYRININPGNKRKLLENYIEKNYSDETLCLEKMAYDLNMNASYLSRFFKENIGQSFSEYLAKYRINKAKELLAILDENVEDIGKRVGLGNRVTFARLFKKIEGVTPGVYREIKKGNN